MIFLISHDPDHREQLKHFFDQRNYEISMAPHRENVCELIKEVRPHVIVLDAYLSSPSPVALLRQIRGEGFKGKVIVLAGPSGGSVIAELLRCGADQVIDWPQHSGDSINMEYLESIIRSVVHPFIDSRAKELFVRRGGQEGQGLEDWLQAEKEILFKKNPS